MLVSHDRALLRAVCDEFWLVGKGEVAPFDGDLDEYQTYLLEEAKLLRESIKEEQQSQQKNTSTAQLRAENKKNQSRLKTLKRNLEKIEEKIQALQQQKKTLEDKLSHTQDLGKITQIGNEIMAIDDSLNHQENEWLELSEELEALT